ncbi:MAG: ABC transporter [Candidatus Dactylopiibacterium carminicum]|uniref:Transport permease protein n=1 Tax=Candidatus Dactylopiibacterium carminicum TaxID=857335 RepID=A0A272EY84_9RHOO|nr:ABC transporter permease [Candidatus Dactylopiibacterium carminicum]KAF7600467.1 ABC transporter permease [Candidatus Dactylopiibacterium carminicum]PAS95088.1 MAG: ABC transporter [Candidatus Dactylopiibacterium carminicum]PAS97805.1 MAG: ABC transporter [Candidatus Dactylopiibacterium carminicum]PAT00465.1 MAG: ABC transporter [Candidatus Dactylopiibacterium carminicum]
MLAALIRKELLALLRDPHGLVALFLMPVAFIVIMSLALQNQFNPSTQTLMYAVAGAPADGPGQQLLAQWQARSGAPQALPEDWRGALRRGQLRYVLAFEPGFNTVIAAPGSPPGVQVRLLTEPGLETALFRTLEAELAASVGELRANAVQERFTGLVSQGANAIGRLVVAERIASAVRPTAVQQSVPAWLVFGMFFVVTAIASLFVQEARDGTLARLQTLGVPRRTQILAKAAPYLGVNAVQAMLMLAVGVWLVPLLGGQRLQLAGIHWPALLLMLTATSLAAIGFALAVACLVRTHAQASALGAACNLLMAAIGGIMMPSFVMPAVMQAAARCSPMNWALEGLLQVLLREGGLAAAMPFVARLAAFAALMWLVAILLFRRRTLR